MPTRMIFPTHGPGLLLETAFNPFTQPAYHYRSSAIDDVKNVLGFKKRTRNLTNKILS